MKLEYLNGTRITQHYHEMNPLQTAITRYEQMATSHYAIENNTHKLTKEEREIKLKESLQHLEHEKSHLHSISNVQTQLEMYREEGEKRLTGDRKQAANAMRMMQAEKHHPTSVLEKHMRAEGTPKPSPNHTAHHILPGSGQYRQMQLAQARLHMHFHGTRINDPANGVYLVTVDKNTPHWSMPSSRGHLKYHTAEYEEFVAKKVLALKGTDFIRTQLQVIGRILQENEPKTAIAMLK